MSPDEPRANELTAGEGVARELLFQEEFEFAAEAQLVTDGHGLVLRANHAAVTVLRCPKEFLPGKPLGLFVAAGYRPRFYECLARLWQGVRADQFETRLSRRGEPPRDVDVRVVAADERGDPRAAGTFRWVVRDVTELRRAEAARAELLRRLVTAQEDERRRVSRELHDSFGQLVTALTLAIKMAREAAPLPPAADARLAEVQQLADELARTSRDLAVRLRPTALDDVGLHAALAQSVVEWAARTGIEADYEAAAEAGRLPAEVETAVYRIVQEALTNVARHAKARRVGVTLTRYDGYVTVAVEDDGVGFDPEAVDPERLGLVGMRERAALAGGSVDVESNPGAGTTVLARFRSRNEGGGGAR